MLAFKNVVCMHCGAAYESPQFDDLSPLQTMVLTTLPLDASLQQAVGALHGKHQSLEFWNSLHEPTSPQGLHLRDRAELDTLIQGAILWQTDEAPFAWLEACQEFIEDKSKAGGVFGARVGHKGYLIITNQRILFACKMGRLAKDYAVTYGINLEDVMSVSHGRFGFNDKLVILERQGSHRDYIKPKIQALIPTINSAIRLRQEQVQREKQRERIHILLDFGSLKNVMDSGGIIMTTYNCPKCNGVLEIPQAGKVLFCSYCGTPVKPVDIFDRIKEFL
jgi:DNA-directed RNA polymerase subunit RPC12/RpoP